jgi:hypothetical protein
MRVCGTRANHTRCASTRTPPHGRVFEIGQQHMEHSTPPHSEVGSGAAARRGGASSSGHAAVLGERCERRQRVTHARGTSDTDTPLSSSGDKHPLSVGEQGVVPRECPVTRRASTRPTAEAPRVTRPGAHDEKSAPPLRNKAKRQLFVTKTTADDIAPGNSSCSTSQRCVGDADGLMTRRRGACGMAASVDDGEGEEATSADVRGAVDRIVSVASGCYENRSLRAQPLAHAGSSNAVGEEAGA